MNLRVPAIRFAAPKQLTGGKVLAMLIAFFGLVILVNFAMMKAAISTFGGVDTKSSYEAGRMFESEVARADAQAARDWKVDAHLAPAGQKQELTVTLRDAKGAAITGVTVQATLAHPVDERKDVAFALAESSPGVYRGQTAVPGGVWELNLLVVHGTQQLFQSKNRVIVP